MRQIFYTWLTLLFIGLSFLAGCNSQSDSDSTENARPEIFPDFTDLVVPVNIAPLNFIIRERAEKYTAHFSSENGGYAFSVKSKDTIIIIPDKKWRELLTASEGSSYQLQLEVRRDGKKITYPPLSNQVSSNKIDPFITYRRINPGMVFWDNMAIVQRSLENFSENDLINNKNTEGNCIHCHTFRERDPETLLLHFRKAPGGTLIKKKGITRWLATKTPYTLSSFVYPSWHPEGRYIAFSTNKIHQNFFGSGDRLNHVRDDASDIVIYDIDSNLVFTSPDIATFDFENLPAWAPSGDYLYFIRCPEEHKYLPDSAEKYDLLRISFDTGSRELGEPELVVSAEEAGLSASFPQISPDGKFLVFCLADYGYFNINNRSSDLYLLNLSDMSYRKMDVNSGQTESWPNWSDNSRWLMFTTKRIDGMFTVPHVAHINEKGEEAKAFPIPYKNPISYFTRITNMNRPVFVKGKVKVSQEELQKIVYSQTDNVVFDSLRVDIDALSGATTVNGEIPGANVLYMKD